MDDPTTSLISTKFRCPFCDSDCGKYTYAAHLERHQIISRRKTDHGNHWNCCCGCSVDGLHDLMKHLDPAGDHVAECAMLVSAGHGVGDGKAQVPNLEINDVLILDGELGSLLHRRRREMEIFDVIQAVAASEAMQENP